MNNSLPHTLICVFSPKNQLVQVTPSYLKFPKGDSFESLFGNHISFLALASEGAVYRQKLPMKDTQEYYNVSSSVLKNPAGLPLAVIVTLEKSLNDEREIDEKLMRMDQLSQIGQLASGMAHEIRNPLAGIMANIHVLKDILPLNSEAQEFFPVINEEIERLSILIQDLLHYAKHKPQPFEYFSFPKLWEKLMLLNHGILHKKMIQVESIIPDTMPLMYGNEQQIFQMFLNLMLNAMTAMESGGKLRLHAKVAEPAQNLEFELQDNGCGIQQHIMEKVFDPFFTTREEGIGLGLAIVHKIVSMHKGTIHIQSVVGEGTRVHICFDTQALTSDMKDPFEAEIKTEESFYA